jgi:uncharacterized Zn-binding protein involved in type VI secretion
MSDKDENPGQGAGSVEGDSKPPDSSVAVGGKVGFKQELFKKEGAKGERAVGNRQPEPKDPNAPAPPKKGPARDLSAGPLITVKNDDLRGAILQRPSPQDETFVEGLKGGVSDFEFASASLKLNEGKGKVVAVKAGVEGTVLHGEADLIDVITAWMVGTPKHGPPPPEPMPMSIAPAGARLGDLTAHGTLLLPGPGSPNVFIGGLPAWRAGIDVMLCAAPGAAPHGAGAAAPGEPTVWINGAPAMRAGDFVLEATGGLNMVVGGCFTVTIGSPAPAPPSPPTPPPVEPPWVEFGAVAKGDMVTGKARVDASADWDTKKAKGRAEFGVGADVALFKAELPLSVKVKIPWTQLRLGLGLTVEGSALSLGAEAGLGAAVNERGKLFAATGGAKVNAGLAGVGMKFAVDISH